MSYCIKINDIPFKALANASDALRKKYNLEQSRIVSDLFEREYGVVIHDTAGGFLNFQDEIEFPGESEYIIFLLKWL